MTRAHRRLSAATRYLVALVALGAGCADNDHTDICLGPGCENYQGIAGMNSLTSGDLGGFGGAGDGGVDAATSDAGSPRPDPCEVLFLTPDPGDGGALTLAGSDDVDGEACGPSFSARVLLGTNAARVNLFVNDNPLGEARVTGGIARFDAELGNRGRTGNSLRAEATMADGRHCSADLGQRVFVGCAGPSCSVDSPRANREGFLNQSADTDEQAAGLQTDIVVVTEAENEGQSVELTIDAGQSAVPHAVVQVDGGTGTATFPGVTLAEGTRTVRAECQDEHGVTTRSPATEWHVDISACSLQIESIADGADPITPSDDLDRNPGNGLDVLVRGSVDGDDCDSIQVGACNADLTDISLHNLVGSDGGFIVPIKLTAQTASLELCARVKDTAGNVSAPDQRVEVSVRADSPRVAIASPSSSTRFNRDGNAGAVADQNPSSGGSCEVTVVVNCTDVGVAVDLLADSDSIASQPCVARSGLDAPFAGRATFAGVSLPSQNDGSTTTLSARQGVPGLPAGVSANVVVRADCEAPSCSIESPDPGTPFLNAALDSSNLPGFQVAVVVATDANGAGGDVRLELDRDPGTELTEAAVPSVVAGASATFADVTLSEASHDVQAFCTDAAGNVQATDITSWAVDLTPCGATLLVASGHDPIVPSDDLDGVTPGLQVSVAGQTSGASCSAARVGLCGSLSGSFADLGGDGSFTLQATLPSVAASGVGVCAEVRDEAGNVASASSLVNVRVDPPVVSFASPSPAATFSGPGGCSTTAVVTCSENGAPVELFADGASQGTQLCSANSASFPLLLLSKNDGSATVLGAVQTAQGVASSTASVSVQADCEAPAPSISQPACNTQLALRGDDVDSNTAGLQLDVDVLNDGAPDVVLTVTAGGSSSVQASGDATHTAFSAVNLGGPGSVSLVACATDAQGNQGCSPSCALSVVAEPNIAITNPRPPAVFTIEHDCDAIAPGLQILVEGTSGAADGSPVVITVGTGTPSTTPLSSGTFSACVQAPDGEDQTLTARVTDTATGLASTASVIVSTNTALPQAILAPTVAVTDRRQGHLDLSWLSVLDASNDPLVAYHLRCARTDITTEANWDAATNLPISVAPATSAGVQQTQSVTNFRTGTQRFCMVRGEDAYGQLSPLSGTAPTVARVSNPFLTLQYSSVTPTTGTRVGLGAVGDVNGDGQGDFVYGTTNGAAEVFFGGPNLDPTPDLVLTGPASQTPNHEFGGNVAGLGDINGDGRPDFAITARLLNNGATTFAGAVFIYFGRASTADWQSLPSDPACPADLCIRGTDPAAALGAAIASTDFDGDGKADLVVGAQNRTADDATQRVGRVYVLLGGSQLNVASGTTLSLPGAALNGFIINPPTTGTRNFGVGIAAVGLGSDTRGDLVLSSLGRNAGGETINGEAFSVLGRAAGSGLTVISAGQPFAVGQPNAFGLPTRAIGDINGDSFGDVWISTNFDLEGVSPAYLGRSTGFSGASLFGFTNDVVDNEWGTFVATGFHTELGRLGDVDQNGFDDVLVGAAFANGAPATAELFYSDATTQGRLRSAADVRFTSAGNGQLTPSFVGDVSGDGFSDIAILDSGSAVTTTLTLFY